MIQYGLPTIARIVNELDGLYFGTSLYELTMAHINWNPLGQHVSTTHGESLTFYSPWSQDSSVRGQFKVFYYDKYPKKCIPSSTGYEIELRETASLSLLIKSWTTRGQSGATIAMYRKDGECVYPLIGHSTPLMLQGDLTEQLEQHQKDPHGDFPALPGAHDGMVYLTHLGLACAVKWQSHRLSDLPGISYLPDLLQSRFKATASYDQRYSPPK